MLMAYYYCRNAFQQLFGRYFVSMKAQDFTSTFLAILNYQVFQCPGYIDYFLLILIIGLFCYWSLFISFFGYWHSIIVFHRLNNVVIPYLDIPFLRYRPQNLVMRSEEHTSELQSHV